jgi:dTDP-4-dehydrorhamnose reductase
MRPVDDRFVSKSKKISTLTLYRPATNQVFDGDTERMLRTRMADGAPLGVLRLAKVVSPGMALLSTWMQELASRRSIRAIADMTMAPTPVDIVAMSIAHMMEDRLPLIAQLTGPRDVTYAEVGHFLAKKIGADPRLVEPVSALENGMPRGSTPRNTTLASSFIAKQYGLAVPDAFDVIGNL